MESRPVVSPAASAAASRARVRASDCSKAACAAAYWPRFRYARPMPVSEPCSVLRLPAARERKSLLLEVQRAAVVAQAVVRCSQVRQDQRLALLVAGLTVLAEHVVQPLDRAGDLTLLHQVQRLEDDPAPLDALLDAPDVFRRNGPLLLGRTRVGYARCALRR
jgi:hypothetical protein